MIYYIRYICADLLRGHPQSIWGGGGGKSLRGGGGGNIITWGVKNSNTLETSPSLTNNNCNLGLCQQNSFHAS